MHLQELADVAHELENLADRIVAIAHERDNYRFLLRDLLDALDREPNLNTDTGHHLHRARTLLQTHGKENR